MKNNNYKDTVFVDLFFSDRDAKKNTLSLYNALHGTSYPDETVIQNMRLEDILYKNYKNDISFMLDNKILVFGEHQSTINPNMPLRSLEYCGRTFEKLYPRDKKYTKSRILIPTPEFYVFYNGLEDCPVEYEMKLSDSFQCEPAANSLELKVKVINIRTDKGHKILSECETLRQYSAFVDTVRRHDNTDAGFKEAIKECMSRDILSEYLDRKSQEVINMLIAEYDYNDDIRVQREEAYDEGLQRGQQLGEQKGLKIGEQRGENNRSKIIFLDMISSGYSEKEAQRLTRLTNQQVEECLKNI